MRQYTQGLKCNNSVSVFEVYPNPTEGKLKLNISLTKNAAVQLRMYSPDGRELYGQSYTNIRVLNEELNLQDALKGVYILRLNVDDEVYYHKNSETITEQIISINHTKNPRAIGDFLIPFYYFYIEMKSVKLLNVHGCYARHLILFNNKKLSI